jgi:tetratricopeptide (TPR) repeat protein
VLLAVAALAVRTVVSGRADVPRASAFERDRVVAEMVAALDLDPRVRLAPTQRLVERAAAYCGDASTESAETLYALGLRRYYGEDDAAGAEEAFRRAHEARPGWAWPLNGLGIVQFVSGRREAAGRSFAEALRLEPGWSRPHADLAILYRRSGDIGEALKEALLALEIERRHPINHYNYGVILDELRRHAEAREEYLLALHLAPDLPQAHYNLACSFAREGDVQRTLGPLTRAIALEDAFREEAADDPDFDRVRDAPEFAANGGGPGRR